MPHNTSGRLLITCAFLFSVCILGCAAVYLIRAGTAFLEDRSSNELKFAAAAGYASRAEAEQGSEMVRRQTNEDPRFVSKRLSRSDFAAAFVTDLGHQDFIKFSRVWRKGITTFVATNQTIQAKARQVLKDEFDEYWGYYPDDKPLHTLALKGDSRAALAPFLAFREIPATFKWMFYGDDDTFFFPDAAAQILEALDPEMPYFLTDHMWWTAKWTDEGGNPHEETHHPHKAAPQCVPCEHTADTSGMPFPYPRGCPCTVQAICEADVKGIFHRGARGYCGMPRVPIRTFSMHGGAGGILSIGLLRKISFEAFEECIATTYSTGGDALISICLWQAGYGMTNPNPQWHPEGLHMFDVGEEAQADHEEIIPRVARLMGNLLQASIGSCEGRCKLELDHLVTLHMRSRKFPSRAAHAEISRVLAALSDVAHGRAEQWISSAKDAKQRQADDQVAGAIAALEAWQKCQALQTGAQKTSCLKEAGRHLRNKLTTSSLIASLEHLPNSASAARSLATYLITQIFERHPSPTGVYGTIPIGRE